jgi:L,D-peptidoglycan transpeptidase YkuD (ErfK/YbiS/YcfS/YnhG family)
MLIATTTGFWDWLSANLPAIMSALIAAWGAWQAAQAKNIGNHNTGGIADVHELADGRLTRVEEKLAGVEEKLITANATIGSMGNTAAFRDGQQAGPEGHRKPAEQKGPTGSG